MSKTAVKNSIVVKGAAPAVKTGFADRLVLNKWMFSLFDVSDYKDLVKGLKDIMFEGYDGDYISKFIPLITAKLGKRSSLDRDILLQYDGNIYTHTLAISKKRGDLKWKYFQYLSLLFTEIYLEKYFNDPDGLLSDLNGYVDQFNVNLPAKEKIQAYTLTDLNKISFWNATGSGKTLIMHMNIKQYRHYHDKYSKDKISKIILLTPNAGLSEQHRREFELSSMHAEFFDKNLSNNPWSGDCIEILDVYKLEEEAGKTTVAVDQLEGNNLVLVDEGHRGSSGDKWMDMRNRLCEDGFSFEYSATFGQAIESAGKKNQQSLYQVYAKSIIFDYSYRFFYLDGYGKDYQILNLPEKEDADKKFYYLAASLLSFYQQKKFYFDKADEFEPFNIENPLMVFVGSSVIGRKREGQMTESDLATISDVGEVINFISDFTKNNGKSVKCINLLMSGKTGLLDSKRNDIFAKAFIYLKTKQLTGEHIFRDILKLVFNCETINALLHVENLKGIAGEVGLKLGDNEYFGVVNIGEDTSFIKLCEKHGIITGDRDFTESLFHGINSNESKINILIGSKKFSEGWNSWRVTTMGLINIGTKEGAQIIQLFGRGVRLKGFKFSLQRSSSETVKILLRNDDAIPPTYMDLLETLHIFGIRANYIQRFREYLEEEGVPDKDKTITIELPVICDIDDKELKRLKIIQIKKGTDFKNKASVVTLGMPPDGIKNRPVALNWYPKIQTYQSDNFSQPSQQSYFEKGKFIEDHVSFLDIDELYFELARFKNERGWFNLSVERSIVKKLLLDDSWYTLYIPPAEMEFSGFECVSRWNNIASILLKKYCTRYYNYMKGDYEKDKREYVSLYDYENELAGTSSKLNEEADTDEYAGYIIKKYTVEMNNPADALIKYLEELKKAIETRKLDNIKGLGFLDPLIFAKHLYKPLIRLGNETIKVSPVALNESESQFVNDIKSYYYKQKDFFMDKDLFLLRNLSRGRGFGFFEAGNFYPDFIMWIITGDKQYITFIDPKGLVHITPDDLKVQFHLSIKDIERDLKDDSVILNSFILSITEYRDIKSQWYNLPMEEVEKRNVLFIVDDKLEEKYIKKMFNRIFDITEEKEQPELFKIPGIAFIKDYQKHAYKDALPFYTLQAACGKFGEGQDVEAKGWVKVIERKGMGEGWFVVQAKGKSMEPKIPDGSYCIFRPVPAGSKEGRILLVQHHSITDTATSGSYTIKKYTRSIEMDKNGEEVKTIILEPLNRDYKPIVLESGDADFEEQIQAIGEFVGVV
jgi:hypothetical protein